MGFQKRSYKTQHKLPKTDNVTIMPIFLGEPQEIEVGLPLEL
jgi:hypothetical protein